MNLEDYIEIGVIGKAKSFKGEVFMHLKSLEFQSAALRADKIQIPIGNKLISYPVEDCYEKNGNTVVVKFKGIDTKELAELIKNKATYLHLDEVSSLQGEELYSHELEGCQVRDETYGDLGAITLIDNTTPQLLAYINYKGSEAVFPLNEAFIIEIDLAQRLIQTKLPEGILEINE